MERENNLQPVQAEENASSLPAVREIDAEALKLKLQYFGWTAVPGAIALEIMGGGFPGIGLAVFGGVAAAYFAKELHSTFEPGIRVAGGVLSLLTNHTGVQAGESRVVHRLTSRDWWLGQETVLYDEDGSTSSLRAQRQQEEAQSEPGEAWDFEGDDEIALPTRRSASKLFTLSDVLRDFKPSIDRIYLGEQEDGTPVFCSAKKLFHVALAGKTGRGKGSLMRLLLAQLCALRLDVLLLNPHYMRWVYADSGMDEDWTPFEPYLKENPLDCVDVPVIENLLRWSVEVLLEKRKARSRAGQRPGKPFFIVIDELPAIIAESKRCADYIAKILNQGRKYGIFMIVASQNFQVKSVSGDTAGADRENYETGYYVGGDGTTAKVLLDMPANQIPETSLGKGYAMLRCAGSPDAEKAVRVRVPFTDNEALYRLLGPSTFQKDDEPTTDDLSDIGRMFEELVRESGSVAQVEEDVKPLPVPVVQEKGPKAKDIELAAAISLWNAGYNSENLLMKAFPGLTKYQAGLLRDRILEQVNE